MRKTIRRYVWRVFDGDRYTGQVEIFRLTRKRAGILRSKCGRYWSIEWLAERWTIEFPDGLHRSRYCGDDPHYHIGNSDFNTPLRSVVILAAGGEGGSRIIEHETFPEPAEANPRTEDD